MDCEQRDSLNQLDTESDNNLTSGLSEVIEIDHETLQRIHDLEVRSKIPVLKKSLFYNIHNLAEVIIYTSLKKIYFYHVLNFANINILFSNFESM